MSSVVGCDRVQAALSAMADGEEVEGIAVAELRTHLEGCTACLAFDRRIGEVRQLLRFETIGAVPDVAPAVIAAVVPAAGARPSRRPPWLATAAAVVAGIVAGAAFVGFDRDRAAVEAADLAELAYAAQHEITSLSGSVAIDTGDGSTYTGSLAYRAPESLAVLLHDDQGVPLATVADGDRWWTQGQRRCAPAAGPCGEPELRIVEGREPFAEAAPVPLDLVAPVDLLALAAPPEPLGRDVVAGRSAIGLTVTAGQVTAIIEGLDPRGALPPAHPTDVAELWLDADHLVPLALTVRAADSPERRRWAAAHGDQARAGNVVLAFRLSDVRINGEIGTDAFPPPPGGAAVTITDGGFEARDEFDGALEPTDLPAGLRPHRRGVVSSSGPAVAVQSWSDGRAWLTVRSTTTWPGGRLFGGLGDVVRPVDLGAAGTGYLDGTGTRIALHAEGIDVAVSGSLPVDALQRVAASLGIIGEPVPEGWAEAASATVAEAAAAVPGLLAPGHLDGFGPPAVRIDGGTVTMTVAGAGDRAFQLVRTELERLPPPRDPDAIGVRVRGVDGRYQPASGDLEWVEQGVVHGLRGAGLGPAELVAIAEALEASP